MKHFAIIVNGFQPFTIVAKSSIFNFAGFLDLDLLCSTAKPLGWFIKPKIMHPYGESIWNQKTIWCGVQFLLNLQYYAHSLLNYNRSQVVHSLPWEVVKFLRILNFSQSFQEQVVTFSSCNYTVRERKQTLDTAAPEFISILTFR